VSFPEGVGGIELGGLSTSCEMFNAGDTEDESFVYTAIYLWDDEPTDHGVFAHKVGCRTESGREIV